MSGRDVLELMRPTFVEVDLGAWRRNLRAAQARLHGDSRLLPVLKADGYGHGAAMLARIAREESVPMVAVALLEEALELHAVVPDLPILILGPLRPAAAHAAIARGFRIGITGPETLSALVEASAGNEAVIHLKLDSGMGRMGVIEQELDMVSGILRSHPHIRVEGLYTHFATADEREHPAYVSQQRRYAAMIERLAREGVVPRLRHVANSAAIWRADAPQSDMARAGLLLLGADVMTGEPSKLEPVLRWKTTIARLKEVTPGESVGYGHSWTATRPSRIATLPVGYADGYDRALSNRGTVLVRGQRAPVVGRVSMDLVTVDVTDVRDAAAGDEVILLGRQDGAEIPVEEIAGLTGTIAYEVFCAISARVPRLWLHEGREIAIGSRFIELLTDTTQ